MKACLDVDYRSHSVVAACACFHEWSDEASTLEVVARSDAPAAPYEPGQFWRREMPYLLEVLARLPALPTTVVVDGYVWLDERKSGLGAHLFDALAGKASVIGVAKRPYRNAAHAAEVVRGKRREGKLSGFGWPSAARAGLTEGVSCEIALALEPPTGVVDLHGAIQARTIGLGGRRRNIDPLRGTAKWYGWP